MLPLLAQLREPAPVHERTCSRSRCWATNRSRLGGQGAARDERRWDAEIINDKPNELIAWRSVEGAEIDNAGSVRFRPAPGGRGTEVTVELNYEPPAGLVGATIARLFGEEPEVQVRKTCAASSRSWKPARSRPSRARPRGGIASERLNPTGRSVPADSSDVFPPIDHPGRPHR